MSGKSKLETMDPERGNRIMIDTQVFETFRKMPTSNAGPILHAFIKWTLGVDESAVNESLPDDLSRCILDALIRAQKTAVAAVLETYKTNQRNRSKQSCNQPSMTVDHRQPPSTTVTK